MLRKIAIAGLALSPLASAAPAWLPQFCSANAALALGQAEVAMGMGMLLLSMVIALAYMAGQAAHEPRLTEWAKSTVPQLGSSLLIFILVMFLVDIGCGMRIGEFANWAGLSPGFSSETGYTSAFGYLEWGADRTETAITFLRAKMGALNIRATTTTFESAFPLGSLGYSAYPNSGDYSISGVHATLLQLNTSFFLAIVFQYFSLLMFTSANGLMLLILPVGLTLRCLPFMRGFGGALVGLIVAIYLIYPFMLAVSYVMLSQVAPNYDVDYLLASGQGKFTLQMAVDYENSIEGDIGGGRNSYVHDDPQILFLDDTGRMFRFTAFNFVRAVLFPSIGLLVTAMMARDLSKLFGDEIDANKLIQMV